MVDKDRNAHNKAFSYVHCPILLSVSIWFALSAHRCMCTMSRTSRTVFNCYVIDCICGILIARWAKVKTASILWKWIWIYVFSSAQCAHNLQAHALLGDRVNVYNCSTRTVMLSVCASSTYSDMLRFIIGSTLNYNLLRILLIGRFLLFLQLISSEVVSRKVLDSQKQ